MPDGFCTPRGCMRRALSLTSEMVGVHVLAIAIGSDLGVLAGNVR